MRTLNLADIEGWIVAETEGCKVANRTLERVGNLPTYIVFKGAGKWPTYFFLIAVGWKVADIDVYVVLRAGTWPTLFFGFLEKLCWQLSSELHNNLCRPLSIPHKTCVGHFPPLRPQIELCRTLSNPLKNIVGQLRTLFLSVIFQAIVSANLRFP